MITEKDILDYYRGKSEFSDAVCQEYTSFHAKRVAYILQLVNDYVLPIQSKIPSPVTMCDIGPNYLLTEQLRRIFLKSSSTRSALIIGRAGHDIKASILNAI